MDKDTSTNAAQPKVLKPRCKLTGTDGNVFALAGRVARTLDRAGLGDRVDEFYSRLNTCEDYDAALRLMMEYVEVE